MYEITVWHDKNQTSKFIVWAIHSAHAFDQARKELAKALPRAIYEACPQHLIRNLSNYQD